MKMDNNLEGNGEESPPIQNGVENTISRQILGDQLTELLEQFTHSTNNIDSPSNANFSNQLQSSVTNHFADILQQVNRGIIDGNIADAIDAASPLGRSLQNKFIELEEISRRLKTRLNQVVCDSDILLSPDGEPMVDLDLERDLNTDSHDEDLTPQEFYQLVQSHLPSTSECGNGDLSDKSDVSK